MKLKRQHRHFYYGWNLEYNNNKSLMIVVAVIVHQKKTQYSNQNQEIMPLSPQYLLPTAQRLPKLPVALSKAHDSADRASAHAKPSRFGPQEHTTHPHGLQKTLAAPPLSCGSAKRGGLAPQNTLAASPCLSTLQKGRVF